MGREKYFSGERGEGDGGGEAVVEVMEACDVGKSGDGEGAWTRLAAITRPFRVLVRNQIFEI
jgi:hypothetical protein